MPTILTTSAPAARGGVVKARSNTRKAARASQIASQWAGRNLEAQSREELRKSQLALIGLGVVPNLPYFDRPSRLLTSLNAILAND